MSGGAATARKKSPTAWTPGPDQGPGPGLDQGLGPGLGLSPVLSSALDLANTPQDYTGGFNSGSSSPLQARPLAPPTGSDQSCESCLSTGSDQESGIADVSCRSLLSEDSSSRDPDSDEAASSEPA